jgi:hypothetical protein
METLQRSLKDFPGYSDAFELFCLAMCHARRGDAVKAKDCYDRALHWVRTDRGQLLPSTTQELDAFRAEADVLLRQQSKP